MTDTCLQIVQDVFDNVVANGVSEESLTKSKEYLLKTYTQNQRENGWWMDRIINIVRRNYDPAENSEEIVRTITTDNIVKEADSD